MTRLLTLPAAVLALTAGAALAQTAPAPAPAETPLVLPAQGAAPAMPAEQSVKPKRARSGCSYSKQLSS